MDTLVYSNKGTGFSSKLPQPHFIKSTERNGRERPTLGYAAFYSGEYVWLREAEKWGVVLPSEVIANLPVLIAISTRQSDTGARIRLNWISTEDGTKVEFGPFDISVPGNDEFIRLPAEPLKQFSGKSVNITYIIEGHGPIEQSPPLQAVVAPELIYQPAVIEGLIDGSIDTGSHPQGLSITIPVIQHLREHNPLSLVWRVYRGSETIYTHSVQLQANPPDKDFTHVIPAQAYLPFKGFKGEFQWFIQLGAEMDRRLLWSTGITLFDLR